MPHVVNLFDQSPPDDAPDFPWPEFPRWPYRYLRTPEIERGAPALAAWCIERLMRRLEVLPRARPLLRAQDFDKLHALACGGRVDQRGAERAALAFEILVAAGFMPTLAPFDMFGLALPDDDAERIFCEDETDRLERELATLHGVSPVELMQSIGADAEAFLWLNRVGPLRRLYMQSRYLLAPLPPSALAAPPPPPPPPPPGALDVAEPWRRRAGATS